MVGGGGGGVHPGGRAEESFSELRGVAEEFDTLAELLQYAALANEDPRGPDASLGPVSWSRRGDPRGRGPVGRKPVEKRSSPHPPFQR